MTPDREARQRWSRAHGDIDPDASVWISGWLTIVHRFTRPLVGRGIPPGRVTAAGVFVSALVPLFAWRGGGWSLASLVCVLAAGVLDGVDGALARSDGSASAWGSVLDDLADRFSDLLMLAALAVFGAPIWLCVAAGTTTVLMESARSSARAAGLRGVGALTVWERPSRLIVASFATGLCGIATLARADEAAVWIAGGAAVIAVALSVVSLLHLLVVLRRQLGGAGGAADVRPDRRAR